MSRLIHHLRRATTHLLLAAALGTAPAVAVADVVTEWNVIAFDTMKAANMGGAPGARLLAIMHVAMADAVNTVQNQHQRLVHRAALQPQASADAAAASAAHAVLVGLLPAQKARVDESLFASVVALPAGAARDAGATIGAEAAAAVLADRANDNSSVPDTYRPVTAPGAWIPTTPPLTAEYARVRPWGFDRPEQFRPGPPPALKSEQYARDYNETRSLGGARSTQRTPQQSDLVKFWSQPNLLLAWYQAARQLTAARGLGLADSARLFAIMGMAQANTFIVDWDAKFHYNFWRPVTAIRNGDNDGNDATERDAGWTSANATPMHPEYPSQAAIVAGAGAATLSALLNTPAPGPIVVTDGADPKLTRTYADVATLAEEQRFVRILGGIHFRSSLETSDRMGQAIVRHLVAQTYRPAQR
jgi:hypothetical protein